MLIHELPPKPNYLRVKVSRRLQRLGAVAIKNTVYALPRTEQSLEDFEQVVREIRTGGGDASVIEARFAEDLSDDEAEALFHTAREADYLDVAKEARRLEGLARLRKPAGERRAEVAARLVRIRWSTPFMELWQGRTMPSSSSSFRAVACLRTWETA